MTSIGRQSWPAAIGLAGLLGASFCDASTVTYGYDTLGRLVAAYYPDGSCAIYRYDAAGNRSQYTSAATLALTANTVAVTTITNIAATFDPRVNNPNCATLTVTAVGTPSHGTAAILSGGIGVTYTPTSGYTGPDAFTYTLSNGQTATGNVSVTVTTPALPPVATSGQWNKLYRIIIPAKVRPTITQSITPIATDPYGYPLTVSAVTQGANGAVTYSGTSITYTYNTNVGSNLDITDGFNYTVSDGHGLTSTSNIVINISVNTNQ